MSKINNKQLVLVSIIWFLIFYLIMWLIGGACTSIFVAPSQEAQLCLAKNSVAFLATIPIIGLFLPFTAWVSFFYWFSPIAGFVFAYFTIKWWNNYFDSKEATSFIFPILMIIFLIVGFSINLGWFYGEYVSLNNARNPSVNAVLYFCFDGDAGVCNNTVNRLNTELQQQAIATNAQRITQYIGVNFWQELKGNIFLTFVFGAIAAWKLLFIRRFFEEKK